MWVVSLPHDQTVAITDRITYSGNTYHAVWINDDETERMLCRVAVQRMN
jgi:hypothetical protein